MSTLSFSAVLICLATGVIIAIVYEYLHWLSIKALPSIKHKGQWLFLTTAARLFILLFISVLIAQDNKVRFLWIMVAFLITRRALIHFAKNVKRKK